MELPAQTGYIISCPARKLILQHTNSTQMAEPESEPRSFHSASKYCNHEATDADFPLRK